MSTRFQLSRDHQYQYFIFPACLGLYLLLSFYVISVFLMGSDFGGQFGHTFKNMIQGTTEAPSSYRILLPIIINGIMAITPDSFLDTMNLWAISARDSHAVSLIVHAYRGDMPPSLRQNDGLYYDLIFIVVTWLCLIGYVVTLYKTARQLMPESRIYPHFAVVIGMMLLPVVHRHFAYPYDYSMLLLMSMCMYFMLKQQWWPYIICLALACINKETALYIIFLYAVYFFRQQPWMFYFKSLILQSIMFVVIVLDIRIQKSDGAISAGIFSSTDQIISIFLQAYSFQTFIAWLTVLFLFTYQWHSKPYLLRVGLWLMAPLTIAYIFLGYPHEYRQFLDFAPLFTLLCGHTLTIAMNLNNNRNHS